MVQNFDIFDFTLSDDDMKRIAAMNQYDSGNVDFSDPNFVRNINNLKA